MKNNVFASEAKQSRREPNGIAEPVPSEARDLTPRNDAVVFSDLLRREELMDHMKHPRNRGYFPDADRVRTENNPLCGDEVTVYIKLKKEEQNGEERVGAVAHWGHGCMISQAAASMLSEHVVGKNGEEIFAMERADVEELLGGTLSPSRVKCAMLPLIALKHGLTND